MQFGLGSDLLKDQLEKQGVSLSEEELSSLQADADAVTYLLERRVLSIVQANDAFKAITLRIGNKIKDPESK